MIQGSRIRCRFAGTGTWSIRFGARTLQSSSSGELQAELVPSESGYFAIERHRRRGRPPPRAGDGHARSRSDHPDRDPGKDLLLPDAQRHGRRDHVGDRRLRPPRRSTCATRRSPDPGEQFEFVEGSLPLGHCPRQCQGVDGCRPVRPGVARPRAGRLAGLPRGRARRAVRVAPGTRHRTPSSSRSPGRARLRCQDSSCRRIANATRSASR